MSDRVFEIPESLKTRESMIRFQQEYCMMPEINAEDKQYDEYVKLYGAGEVNARLKHNLQNFTYLEKNYFVFDFMDIPSSLVKKIDFISENVLEVTFNETVEFCVEKYFRTNFDVLKDKKLILRYINKKGEVIRNDEYTVVNLVSIKKESLDINEYGRLKIKVVLECKNHDISTCKK